MRRESKSTLDNTDPDHIYYNIDIVHNDLISVNGSPTPAKFFETRTTPLVEVPEDYYMSVIRFSVPSGLIPLQIIAIDTSQTSDPNKTIFSVTLSYGSDDYQTYLEYVCSDRSLPVPPPPTLGEPVIRSKYYQYYSLYSVQLMLYMINKAFNHSFTALETAHPGIVSTQPPIMTFNAATNLFALYAQTEYLDVDNIKIYMNNVTNSLFGTSFNSYFNGYTASNGKNVEYVLENLYTNNATIPTLGDCYRMDQEFNTIPNWLSFQSLVFTSGNVPIRKEWIPTQDTNSGISTGIGSNFLPIVTDFHVNFETGQDIRNILNYLPTAQYRMVDLKGKTPLTQFDLEVYWQDNYSNRYLLMIPAHNVITVKILFQKKTLTLKNPG